MNEGFTEQDFENLKNGDSKALDKLYVHNHQYIISMLIHRHDTLKEDAQDVFMDAILKFYSAVQQDKVKWGNVRAYLLKIAINLKWEKKRKEYSTVQKMENALQSFYDGKKEGNFNKVIEKEDQLQELSFHERKIGALRSAWGELDDICKELLNDTIVNDLKPRFLVDKFAYKSARVITDKKMKCKQKLLKLVQKKLVTP